MRQVIPNECYHLAAQSFVSYTFEDEFSTTNVNGTHYLLSTLKGAAPGCRFYFAASSEMFGRSSQSPQDESTPFHPRSVYGISKVASFDLTRNYRESYSMHASSGILYNHESPRRGFEFVPRKITRHVARIKFALAGERRLGNLEAKRDWGHARGYVEAMWLMLQQDEPGDYCVATGQTHSVRELADRAFSCAGLHYRDYVVSDQRFYREDEPGLLRDNPAKAKCRLGWLHRFKFDDLVREMVETDLCILRQREDKPVASVHRTRVNRRAIANCN